MTDDAFKAREQALENEFFYNVDKQLLAHLRDDIAHARSQEELAAITGLENPDLLDELLEAGIEGSKVMAFMLLPLAIIAWADGQVDEEEKQAVLNTATALGYGEESASQALLNHWLSEQPDEALFEVWRRHARTIAEHVRPLSWQQLGGTIATRAEKVARATGGVFGLATESTSEHELVNAVKRALLPRQEG